MGNQTIFYAIDIDEPEDKYEFHRFEYMWEHDYWKEVIPEDAPNDILYRLEYGPSYSIIVDGEIQKIRKPDIIYKYEDIREFNSESVSAFDIDEFKLIYEYIAKHIEDENLSDSLNGVYYGLEALFRMIERGEKKYNVILLEYFG